MEPTSNVAQWMLMGVAVFAVAAITVYVFPGRRPRESSPLDRYAPPFPPTEDAKRREREYWQRKLDEDISRDRQAHAQTMKRHPGYEQDQLRSRDAWRRSQMYLDE